ncbi:MAG: hypothetical protein NW206_14475 [Hyphomonadaceae bacterium]|nr:hypothetical protein [Hyphomonadaceae bacterium]
MPADIANVLRPVAEPILVDDVYTADQHSRLLDVVRRNGPWPMIIAQHFDSPEALVATLSGALPAGVTPTFDMFLTPTFRGYLAQNGACLYPEIEDAFYNSRFLELARGYWKAKYATPSYMLFNIQGACDSMDPAHLDATSFRGLNHQSAPTWLCNTMAKSGLFTRWMKKMCQVITWYYESGPGGGFTYWPEGPMGQPKRLAAPMWNKGVVVQNEMMYHRGEANGPADQRKPKGLLFESMWQADPASADGWLITSNGEVIQKVPAKEMRFLVHWNAEVFADLGDLKQNLDHTDDISTDQVFDIFIKDLRARGVQFEMPTDPLRDPVFIALLNRTYDVGTPRIYPQDAPGPQQIAA